MKRILFILLCIALLCQPFAVSAEGAGTAETTETVSTDLLLAKRLGLMADEFTDASVITRRDLANTFANILLGESTADSVFVQELFSDCEETDYGIYTAAQAGLMKGVGEGLFAPDEPVTYNQLMKTVVAFLGYEREALASGGYPGGYLIMATRLKLSAGDAGGGNAKVTARKLASVLKLAQNVEMQYVLNGQLIKSTENYLSAYKGIERKRGIVTAVHTTDVYSDNTMDYYDIKLNDQKIVLESDALAAKDLLGYRIDLYTRGEKNAEILQGVCFEELKNDVLTIESREMISADGNILNYYDSDYKEKRAEFETNAPVIYNGTVCTSYDKSVLNPFQDYTGTVINASASAQLDGSIKLIDHNGDENYDFVIIDAFDALVVSSNIDGKIYNKYRPDEVIDILNLKDKDVEFTNILGQPIPVDYPDEGDIISVSRDLAGNVKRLVLTVDTYTGEVREIVRNGENFERLYIQDTDFACSRSLTLSPELAKLRPGMKVKVYFNKNSEISDIEVGDFIENRKGILIGAEREKGISDDFKLKIFSQSGKFTIANLANKVRYNDGKYIAGKDMYDVLTSEHDSTGKVKRRVLLYSLNAEGKIDKITLSDDSVTEPNDTMYMYRGYDGVSSRPQYKRETCSFGNELLINGATAIFVIPPESGRGADDDYHVVTPDYFETYSSTPLFKAYGTNVLSPVADVLVIEGEYSSKMHEGVGFFAIDKITKVADEQGETRYKLAGIYEGKSSDILVKEESMPAGLAQGDVITMELEQDGMGKNLTLLFDESENKLCTAVNPSSATFTASPRYLYGRVTYSDGVVMTVETPDGLVKESYPLERFTFIEYNSRTGMKPSIRLTSKDAILDATRHPGNESAVMLYTWSAYPKYIVIYNR